MNHIDAIDRTGLHAEVTAGALAGDHCVHLFRRAEDGVVCIFENNPTASPETGWDFGSNPARLLAVSQAEPLPGQHPVLSYGQQQPPAPPGAPPMV